MAEMSLEILDPAGGQVVDDGDLVTALQELPHQMTSDESGPARDDCSHEFSPCSVVMVRAAGDSPPAVCCCGAAGQRVPSALTGVVLAARQLRRDHERL